MNLIRGNSHVKLHSKEYEATSFKNGVTENVFYIKKLPALK